MQYLIPILHTLSTKSLLLLRTLHSSKITRAILDVELNIDFTPQIRLATIQGTSLDTGVVRHHLQLGVQAGTAGWAEEVLVDLAGGSDNVVGGGGSCRIRKGGWC